MTDYTMYIVYCPLLGGIRLHTHTPSLTHTHTHTCACVLFAAAKNMQNHELLTKLPTKHEITPENGAIAFSSSEWGGGGGGIQL